MIESELLFAKSGELAISMKLEVWENMQGTDQTWVLVANGRGKVLVEHRTGSAAAQAARVRSAR